MFHHRWIIPSTFRFMIHERRYHRLITRHRRWLGCVGPSRCAIGIEACRRAWRLSGWCHVRWSIIVIRLWLGIAIIVWLHNWWLVICCPISCRRRCLRIRRILVSKWTLTGYSWWLWHDWVYRVVSWHLTWCSVHISVLVAILIRIVWCVSATSCNSIELGPCSSLIGSRLLAGGLIRWLLSWLLR